MRIRQNAGSFVLVPAMIHSFSSDLATEFGISSAIVYSYVAHVAAKNKDSNQRAERYTGTIRDICTRIPYLSRNAIHEALTRLSAGTNAHEPVLQRIKPKHGHGVHYKVTQKEYMTKNVHRFSTKVASEHGIVPAIVY